MHPGDTSRSGHARRSSPSVLPLVTTIAKSMASSTEEVPPLEQTRSSRLDRVVCTSCRQSKVRCVGSEVCTRCERLGLECRRDTNFKRVCKTRKIAELEKQVERLTSVFNGVAGLPTTSHGSGTTPPYPASFGFQTPHYSAFPDSGRCGTTSGALSNSPVTNIQCPATNFTPSAPSEAPVNPQIYSIFHTGDISPWMGTRGGTRAPARSARQLQSVYLTTIEIDALFHIFFEQYHPFLPFLDPTQSPDESFGAGPVLFWTIIGIASRRYTDDIMLFTALSDWVPKLLWTAISSPPYTIAVVQAAILSSYWPFPSTSMWHETLSTLSAISISTSMQLGLHRPMHATDWQKSTQTKFDGNECQTRIKTWAAANIVSQRVESTVGLLPTTPFGRTLDLACETNNTYTLSDALRVKLMIQKYCHKVKQTVCKALSEQFDESGPPLPASPQFTLPWQIDLDTLEAELNKIEQEHSHHFTVHDRVYIAAAHLYASSMFFYDPSTTDARKQGVLKAYHFAVNLILIMMEADATCSFLSYISACDLRMFLIAICTLLKVLRSSYSSSVDYDAGKKLCNRATGAISRCSVANNDTTGKTAKLVAQVWHSSNTAVLNQAPQLLVRSRLGASLLYDFIWTWRQEFGGDTEGFAFPVRAMPEIDLDIVMSRGVFQDASIVDLDFLNDPDWMEALPDAAM